MKQLIFQFSTSHEWQSAIIRDVCGSPFSHVDAVLDDGSLYGASNSPKAPVVRGNAGGVAVRPGDYQAFKIRRRATVEVTDEQCAQFWQLAEGELGKRFDSDAVTFKNFFNDEPFLRDWRYDDCWFCPELQAWLLEQIGFWRYPLIIPKNRIAPHNLLDWLWPSMINREQFWLFPAGLTPMADEELEMKNMPAAKVHMLFTEKRKQEDAH